MKTLLPFPAPTVRYMRVEGRTAAVKFGGIPMKTVYEGARCDLCANQIANSKKLCRPCLTRNGRPGFEPREGVELQTMQSWVWERGREVEKVIKRVVAL